MHFALELRVRLYDADKADILSGFLSASQIVGIEVSPVETVNRSLTQRELNVMRALNERIPESNLHANISRQLAFKKVLNREPFLITKHELERLRRKFASDVDNINASFLPTGDLKLRSDDIDVVDSRDEITTESDAFYIDTLCSVVVGIQEFHKAKESREARNGVTPRTLRRRLFSLFAPRNEITKRNR